MERRLFLAALASRLAWASRREIPDLLAFDNARVLRSANRYLKEKPLTITSARAARSAGGLHDFFSEGDYWWPDPKDPRAPYVQRDGMTNPDNFVEHRRLMVRLSLQVPALTAAWRISGKKKYAEHALRNLRAWFVDDATRMNPSLLYAQAIQGRATGRGIGIIDTLHLVEVARSAQLLRSLPGFDRGVEDWFAQYLEWMTTHPYGIAERDAANNHATCWILQVAAFAELTGSAKHTEYCAEKFKTFVVGKQMALDGSFPLELKRTKPYGYSLFVLEAAAGIAQVLGLWKFELPDGRGMKKAVDYLEPYIRDKSKWPLAPDVMYHEQWPMRQASLLFAARAFDRDDYYRLWKRLPAESKVEEVVRNFFIRQPKLWV